ncbi:antibiotic biosynthesis monooxygenase [Marinomonas sp. 5E14-1]|uniref:putative quinol monooxygenase n=1 Tax=Marinomonas sp. 5E14-1 TaxID=3153922 RepID=UPI003267AA2C
MSKVTLKGFVLVSESEFEIVKAELVNYKRLTLEESGCIHFRVTESPISSLRFDVYEEFKNKAAFGHHQNRVKVSYWGKMTENVERHSEIIG